MPGTFGSLAGVLLFFIFWPNPWLYFLVLGIVTLAGFKFSTDAEQVFSSKDPRQVVIDEVSGMMISLIGTPYDWHWVLLAFFLFRLFDTLKPYPAHSIQKMHGAIGIMSDDLIAGGYTFIVVQAIVAFNSFKLSLAACMRI